MTGRLVLLGGARMEASTAGPMTDRPPLPVPADRRGWLLALVAVRGDWVSRDLLATRFWPADDETNAKRNLRQLLRRLKQHPVAAGMEIDAQRVRWAGDSDVSEFRRALADGRLEAAVRLYGGPLLAGFPVVALDEVADEFEAAREGLHQSFRDAAIATAEVALVAGRADEACAWLRRMIEDEPLAEDVLQRYLAALVASGRREAAREAYERFARRLRDELDLAPLEATEAQLVDPRNPAATTVHRTVPEARPAPIVGRDAERQALRTTTERVVLVAGEAGIGKSHLLGATWPDALRTAAVEALTDVPFHPLTALLRDPRLDLDPSSLHLEDLARLAPEAAPHVTPAPLAPDVARARALEALAHVWRAVDVPIVVDDLHWADGPTLEALALVAERGGRVLGAYRSDEPGPRLEPWLTALRGRGRLRTLALGPLEERAMVELAHATLAEGADTLGWARYLRWRTGGHPLFALETLRAALEAGIVATDPPPAAPAPGTAASLGIPTAVRDVVDRRLSRLAPATLRVLEAEATVTSGLDAAFLAAVTGLSQHAVEDALDEAERAGVLAIRAPTAADAARAHAFAHDLWREALAARPTATRRRALHARAATTLERRRRHARPRVDAGVVARHWVDAGRPTEAIAAYLRQVAGLRARGLHQDAITVLETALTVGGDPLDLDRARVVWAELLRERDRPAAAEAVLARVEAAGHDDARLRFDTAMARVALDLHHGHLERAQAPLSTAGAIVATLDDPDARREHALMTARWWHQRARPREAYETLAPVVAELRGRSPDPRTIRFVSALAAVLDDLGRGEEALALHREALDLARALGARYQAIDATTNLLFCLADLGRHAEGIDLAEATLATDLGGYDNVLVLRNNVAAISFEAGRLREALAHYEALTRAEHQPYLRTLALARSADALTRLGEPERVPRLLDATIASLTATDYPVARARAAVAVLRLGSDDQVARLLRALPDLDPADVPAYQRDELETAFRARGIAPDPSER